MRSWLLPLLLLLTALAGCADESPPLDADGDGFTDEEERQAGTDPTDATSIPTPQDTNNDGIVVVAVIDGAFNPYHLDMVGSMMPQHLDRDPSNDLPLDQDPHTWIPGFPADPEAAFASYNRIELDLDYAAIPSLIDESINSNALYADDANAWAQVKASSTANAAHYNYFPGTKVIGMVNTGGGDAFAATSHGVGTSTVSVGNIHGSCPECLLVFVNNGGGEHANNWVMQQDWIDVQTNSYGYSTAVRDRMYAGSDVDAQRQAVENGQAIFFSAGNGQGNTFTVPNPTLFSSQEGPDWIVTVGAIDPTNRDSYMGHGRPSDVASIGSGYPSGGYCDNTINCTGNFGGTSNATPVTAGMYAKALWELRNHQDVRVARPADSPNIVQGVPSEGGFLDDGNLTAPELMDAMFLAAEHKGDGTVLGITGVGVPAETAEIQFLAEGHGGFVGRLDGELVWMEEVNSILRAAVHGEGEYIDGEEDWFINDSYCRQSIWGTWDHGAYDGTNLPGPDPTWPLRTALQEACPTVVATVVDVLEIRDGA